MRRKVTAGLLAVGLVLSGCGRDSTTGGDKAKNVDTGKASGTITVWAQGSEGEQLGAFAKQFEAANPGVKVNVTPMGMDVAHDKIIDGQFAAAESCRHDPPAGDAKAGVINVGAGKP